MMCFLAFGSLHEVARLDPGPLSSPCRGATLLHLPRKNIPRNEPNGCIPRHLGYLFCEPSTSGRLYLRVAKILGR